MPDIPVNVTIRKAAHDPDIFEFTIATPVLRSQFRIPRQVVNKLRIMIEKALVNK
jgi:hypothetical protein